MYVLRWQNTISWTTCYVTWQIYRSGRVVSLIARTRQGENSILAVLIAGFAGICGGDVDFGKVRHGLQAPCELALV